MYVKFPSDLCQHFLFLHFQRYWEITDIQFIAYNSSVYFDKIWHMYKVIIKIKIMNILIIPKVSLCSFAIPLYTPSYLLWSFSQYRLSSFSRIFIKWNHIVWKFFLVSFTRRIILKLNHVAMLILAMLQCQFIPFSWWVLLHWLDWP